MKKTLYEKYLSKTTLKYRNSFPREEGIIAGLSDAVENESSLENLPKALHKLHEYHKLSIDRNVVEDEEELEKVALMFDFCFAMMVFDEALSKSHK